MRNNFKTKDWVLVRDNDNQDWELAIFAYHKNGDFGDEFYTLNGMCYNQCIPYEGNEVLLSKGAKLTEEIVYTELDNNIKRTLVDGEVVETREGKRYMVLDMYFVCKDHNLLVSEYDDYLNSIGDKKWDIVKVYYPVITCFDNYFLDENLSLFWHKDDDGKIIIENDYKEKKVIHL